MARIAIIGGSDDDKSRDELVEKITRELIARGHQVIHGGINSGTMKACRKAGGEGVVFDMLIEKDIAFPGAVNVSYKFCAFGDGRKVDFGPGIRRQLLTKEMDLVICFEGGIGTFDELIGAIKAMKKIVFVGQFWDYLLYVLAGQGLFKRDDYVPLFCKVFPHYHFDDVLMPTILAHLES